MKIISKDIICFSLIVILLASIAVTPMSISSSYPYASADNSTATVSADNSTATVSAEESVLDHTIGIVSEPDNTLNEVVQIIHNATLSLQFDNTGTKESTAIGDVSIEGRDETSLKLDGEGDFVQITNASSTRELTNLSLSAWVKPDYSEGSPEFTVISKENAFVIAINNNIPPQKIAKFFVFDGIKWSTVESKTTIEEEWTHLAATFNGSSISIYVNGNLESTLSITGVPTLSVNGQLKASTVDSISSDSDIVIGASLNTRISSVQVSNQFSGLIDNVSLYDSLLEPSQISEIYGQNMLTDSLDVINATSIVPINATDGITSDFELEHEYIEIGKPVTWIQNVILSNQTQNVAIELPADAEIIQVTTVNAAHLDGQAENATTFEITDTEPEQVIISLDQSPEMVQEEKPTKLIVVNGTTTELNIIFETPAPYTIEEDQSTAELYNKLVTVTHNSTLHYTNVTSYSDIPENLVSQGVEFKLYWLIDGERTDVTADPRFAVEFVDTNDNGIEDQMRWIVPKLSEQQFVIEAQITIINVQSYPSVGGNWTVRFTTVGTADLIITGIDRTTFGESYPDDLMFLELNNGTHTLTPIIQGNSIIYRNYSSNLEGFESSKVLTKGKHHLEFRFGNDVKHAYNMAGSSAYADGTKNSGHITTDCTNRQTLTTLSTTFGAGNNLIIASLQFSKTNNADRTVDVGIYKGSTLLAENQYAIKLDRNSGISSHVLIAKDAGAGASPTYTVKACANGNNVEGEAKIISLSGLIKHAYLDGSSTTITPTGSDVTISSLATTLPAGDNLIFASVQVDNGNNAQTIAAGNIKIKNTGTGEVLSTNQYNFLLGTSGADAPFDTHAIMLIAKEPSSEPSQTYAVTLNAGTAGAVAEAKMLVLQPSQSMFSDGGSQSIPNTDGGTTIATLSTTFSDESEIVVIAAGQFNDTNNGIEKIRATDFELKESGTTVSSNEIDLESTGGSPKPTGFADTLLWRTPSSLKRPTYTIVAEAVSNGLLGELKTAAFTIQDSPTAPSIASVIASDGDGIADDGFSNGDTITVKFTNSTNRPPVATKSQVDGLFTFSQSLGNNYVGEWINPSTLVITIVDSTGATPPAVG
ncbi:MAG: LamG domain-containing protein, partial [Nitrosopumilaceae archaeon]